MLTSPSDIPFERRVQRFILRQLNEMQKIPALWASSRESFGLQIVLLVDSWWIPSLHERQCVSFDMMKAIFGPGNSLKEGDLDKEWVDATVEAARKMLGELGVDLDADI